VNKFLGGISARFNVRSNPYVRRITLIPTSRGRASSTTTDPQMTRGIRLSLASILNVLGVLTFNWVKLSQLG